MHKTQQNLKILALFDFCETLVDFQSAARYLELVANYRGCNKNHSLHYRIYTKLKYKITKRLNKILPTSWCNAVIKKPVTFEVLRDFRKEEAELIAQNFFKNELLMHLNHHIIERIHYHQNLGHTIAIVSGGFEIYIRLFAKYFDIPYVAAVSLESNGEYLSGNMSGIHTMEYRKLYKLAQMLNLSEYDLQQSYAYSDCPSDIPLLALVGNGMVVECGKDIEWAKILGFSLI